MFAPREYMGAATEEQVDAAMAPARRLLDGMIRRANRREARRREASGIPHPPLEPTAQPQQPNVAPLRDLMRSWLAPLGIAEDDMPTITVADLGTRDGKPRRGQYGRDENTIRMSADWVNLFGQAKDRKSQLRALETLAHEVGHFLDYYIQRTASPEERAALEDAYAKWRADHEQRGSIPGEVRASRSSGVGAFDVQKKLRDRARSQQPPVHPNDNMEYQLARNEWFADQIGRDLLGQSIESDSPQMHALVKRAAELFRRFYRVVAETFGWPATDQAVAEFLARMRTAAAAPPTLNPETVMQWEPRDWLGLTYQGRPAKEAFDAAQARVTALARLLDCARSKASPAIPRGS